MQLKGVRNLVEVSAQADRAVPVILISSVLAAIGPEAAGVDGDNPLPTTGYGCSKLIAERILMETATASSVPKAVIRVGQIAGSETEGINGGGIWSKQEWVPSIIGSSVQSLGVLPRDTGAMNTIQWLPVDRVASIVLDVAGVSYKTPIAQIEGYFYCVNPHKTTWTNLAVSIAQYYGQRIRGLLDWEEWLEVLEKSSENGLGGNPAAKLLDFFKYHINSVEGAQERLSYLMEKDLERTMIASQTLAETKAISSELMAKWCSQWAF
ncbi:nonribosomal peptide [Colletotrichum higginsianum]|nr:nonribosomal peptide [Colletotrichum higginsianum]